jgi:glutamate racemase
VKAIVVACNTASAVALEAVRDELDIPIIGVVRPGARVAVSATRNKKIGIIGTETTVNSQMYTKLIQGMDEQMQVIGKACPLFVPLVEEGWIKDPVTEEVAKRYLADLQKSEIDTLILGCTHYPLLRHMVGEIMGESVTLVNPAYETAVELRSLLEREGIANDGVNRNFENPYEFFVSDLADKFKVFANSILPCDVTSIKKINIEEY